MGRRTSGESQITESQITAKILSQLKRLGGFWYKTHGGPFQVRGLPDIIGCYQGAFYGLEVKVPGRENTLTAYQSHMLETIQLAGGHSGLVTSPEAAVELVKREEYYDAMEERGGGRVNG